MKNLRRRNDFGLNRCRWLLLSCVLTSENNHENEKQINLRTNGFRLLLTRLNVINSRSSNPTSNMTGVVQAMSA